LEISKGKTGLAGFPIAQLSREPASLPASAALSYGGAGAADTEIIPQRGSFFVKRQAMPSA